MSIYGIPAGMSPLAQSYALMPQRASLPVMSSLAAASPAARGARLVGDDVGSSNRFVRAFRAALAELGIGRSVGMLPLTATMPIAPVIPHAAPAKVVKKPHAPSKVKPVRVPSSPHVAPRPSTVMTQPMAPMPSPFGLPGMGMGMSTGPAAGMPQMNASNQSGLAMGTNGLDQHVTNDNTLDDRGYSMAEMPYGMSPWSGAGFGYGVGAPYASVMGWNNPMGYAPASPLSAYGASMTGAYNTQPASSGIGGFFNRLIGR